MLVLVHYLLADTNKVHKKIIKKGKNMNPQANIDTETIRGALQRRAQGMGSTPQVSQMTAPMGSLPTGGFNTPVNPKGTKSEAKLDDSVLGQY